MPPTLPHNASPEARSLSLPNAVITAAVAVLVVLTLVTHYALGTQRTDIVKRALADSDRNAQALSVHAREVIERVDQTLRVAQSLRESHHAMSLIELRRAGLVADDLTRAIFLTDRHGTVNDSTSPDVALNVADEDDFKQHKRNQNLGLTIGAPMPDVLAGGHVIPVMRRLVREDGEFDGVAIAWMHPAALTRGFGVRQLPGDAINVTGRDGIVRSRLTNGELSFGAKVDVPAMLQRSQHIRDTLEPLFTRIDGKSRFFVVNAVEGHPLLSVVATSADNVMAEYAAERDRIVAWATTIGLLVVIGAGLLWTQARQLDASRREARRAHALYKATLEGGLDALWLLRAVRDERGWITDFRITESNGRAATLLGHSREAMQGQLATELVPTIRSEGLFGVLVNAMIERRTRELEAPGVAPQVRGRWLHYQVVPLDDGVALVVRDIDERKQAERLLAERESFLRALLDALPTAVYSKSARPETLGQVLFWNRAAETQYGRSAESVIGRLTHDYLPQALADEAVAQDLEVAREGRVMTYTDLRYDLGEGQRFLNFVKAPVRGADGEIDHVLVIAEDITEKRVAAAQLNLVSRVVQETGDAVVLTDADDRIVLANAAFAHMTGWSHADVLSRPAGDFGLPALNDAALPGVQRALADQHAWSGEGIQQRADGSHFETWLHVTDIAEPGGAVTHHARLFSDISVLKAQERQLADLARLDGLTQLANRRHFEEQLALAVARAQRNDQPLALVFLDLDGFKAINDTLGHEAGDQLLIEVARRLRASVRATDLVSRLGGDEFTVILESAGNDADQRAQCERLLADLSRPHVLNGRSVVSTPSIGLAVYRPGEPIADLRQRADTAMYTAKRAGKGRVRIAPPDSFAA